MYLFCLSRVASKYFWKHVSCYSPLYSKGACINHDSHSHGGQPLPVYPEESQISQSWAVCPTIQKEWKHSQSHIEKPKCNAPLEMKLACSFLGCCENLKS